MGMSSAHCQGIVREMSGNFRVSGEWSPGMWQCVPGLVTQLPDDFYNFMLELQGKLAKMIKSVGKIEHALYPFTLHSE